MPAPPPSVAAPPRSDAHGHPRPRVVAIGNFDGVHRGHQSVIAEVAALAREPEWIACALTFEPHPMAVVVGGAPPMLATVDRRVELLMRAGADEVVVRRFDTDFAAWAPERFARELLKEELGARVVLVGENFRFGAAAAGDLAGLKALGAELGFEVRTHGLAADAGGAYSSTRARTAIASGDVVETARVLGRCHAITGVVGHGAELGRTLGFPTANLIDVPEMVPSDGIYAVVVDLVSPKPAPGAPGAEVDARTTPRALAVGAMSIGMRPTIDGAIGRTLEVFLLDFEGDLYGTTLRVHFVARLRDELKLDSLAALKVRIARDVAETRTATAGIAPGPGGAYG